MPYVITDACIDITDRACVDQCPVDCIEQGERMLYINPDDCIDCGACEPVCPQGAIHLADALPDTLKVYEAVNAEFYTAEDCGPGGGGQAGTDHPEVARMPRRDQE